MQVDLNKVFPMAMSSDTAWKFLQNIEGVAVCMPGAEITEKVDDNNYKGKVKVKLGPATVAFNGTVEIKGIDVAKRELRMLGSGIDTKGTSTASMDLTARIRDANGQRELVGEAAIIVNGKLASFGGRMMTQVADQILDQFAANFATNAALAGDQSISAANESIAKPAVQTQELNAIKLIWNVIIGFFKSLFRGK